MKKTPTPLAPAPATSPQAPAAAPTPPAAVKPKRVRRKRRPKISPEEQTYLELEAEKRRVRELYEESVGSFRRTLRDLRSRD
jgi:hypothetical protein